MLFSVIIINYKTPQLTAACIHNLLDLPGREQREIIVIDNNSADGSPAKFKNEFGSSLKLVTNNKNLGFSGANNQGAALAQGDFILFLNSDTVIKNNIFESCFQLFKQDEKIGIVSPRLLATTGEPQKIACGQFPTLYRLIVQSGKNELETFEEDKAIEIDWVSGCALMIRKALFEKIGGFDDHFFLYFEDIDLCRRIKQAGYKIIVSPKAKIIHLEGQSLELNRDRKKYYYRSQDYYFKKNYGILTRLLVKIFRLPYRILKNFN